MTQPGPEAPSYRRSPYLVVTWDGGDVVLEQCDSLRRFRVDSRLLELLAALGDWTSQEALAARGRAWSPAELGRLVDLGVVERRSGADGGQEACWSPIELAVQRRTATGGTRPGLGGPGTSPPPAAFKDIPPGPVTSLPPAPPLSQPLDAGLAARRSRRSYGERALHLAELSGVLWHSARVIGTASSQAWGETATRPFASAGGRCELEVYVVANEVEGLRPGAHYYDPRNHRLAGIKDADAHQAELNRQVHMATGGLSRDPPAILVVTAVFARVMWKYEGIGLALIYKDLGCLVQTLYLASAALGLAPCAVGGGQESANARWLGLDPLVEAQVGALVLGPAEG